MDKRNGLMNVFRIAVGILMLGLLLAGWAQASVLNNEHSDLFYLKNGYAIRIIAIDQETFPAKLWIALEKEDIKIDDAILNSGEEYSYKKDLDEINLNVEGFADKENSIVFLKNLYQSSNGKILLNFEKSTLYPSNSISSFQETTNRVNSYSPISGKTGVKKAESIGYYAVRQITVDHDGLADYPTIQQAIDAANSGDTIYVKNGTYFEHLLILKDNLMIIGENKDSTIIDGGGAGDVIILMGANNNTIKEITIQNGKTDPVVLPPVSGNTRVFLKENYSFTANAIEARTSPRLAWITLRKNDTIIDDVIIEEGTLFNRSGLNLSLKVDKIFAGTSSEYILFSNITQYSDTNHNIIVQDETAMLKVGEKDDFVPLKGGIEWGLDENYALSILDVDIRAFPRQTMLLLSKNGAPVEFKIIKTGDMYTFNKSGRLILSADIEAIFGGPGVYLAKLSHVYQYSESKPDLLLNDGSHMYIVGNPRTVKWELLQNYSLTAMDIDSRSLPRLIWFELSKDSVVIEDKILGSGNDYSFYNDSSKILSLNVGEIFDGRKSDLTFVSNVYQYSEADVGIVLKQNESHIFHLSSSYGIDWQLEENYTISFMDADINIFPAQVWIQMKKTGDIVDDRIVIANQIYSYTNSSGRLIFNGKIDTIFSGNLDLLKIIHADQYSEVDGTPLILNATRSFYPINLEYVESLSDKFQIYENYSITPVDISVKTSPRRVWIRLYKSGTLVDEKILKAPMNSLDFQNYSYYSGGRMIISTKLDTIFSGATSDMMQFKDFYQYSEFDGAPLMYVLKKTLSVGARLSIINAGMTLDGSNSNTLQDLRVLNNFYGIYLKGSSTDNLIYHNNFVNNNRNGYDDYSVNRWDNGYPSGGNFWSDYSGTDLYKGSNQDQPGSDGIGDRPYNISGGTGAQDRYPFMNEIGGAQLRPHSLSILINQGDAYSRSRNVTLRLSAIGATEMSFSNDGSAWSSWEPYTMLKLWTLAEGEGLKTVYFKARNSAGEAAPVTDTIIQRTIPSAKLVEIRGTVVNEPKTPDLMPEWNGRDFAGFYYDFKYDRLTESLKIAQDLRTLNGSRVIGKDMMWYNTTKIPIDFNAFGKEGVLVAGMSSYDAVGWQGEKYVAIRGFANKIAKLTLEMGKEDKKTLINGSNWSLGSGYEMTIDKVDARLNPRQVWFTLRKDGAIIEQGIGQSRNDSTVEETQKAVYYKTKKILGESDALLFTVYVDSIFSGATSDMVQFKYAWLIDEDSAKEIHAGDIFDVFQVRYANQDQMSMTNEIPVNFSRNTVSTILGNIKFKFADSDQLRFYPFVTLTTPGTYEIRGTVANDPYLIPSWDASSFAGLYYNLDSNIKTERLSLTEPANNRTIEKEKLWYNTTKAPVDFKVFENEGLLVNGVRSYNVTGWQGEKYVAINDKTNKLAGLVLEMGKEDIKRLTTGETWSLGAGYELTIKAVDARSTPRQVWFTLKRYGEVIDEGIGQAPENSTDAQKQKAVYYKTRTIMGESDALLFTVYVDTIYSGATSDMVQFKYAWLIDESNAKEIMAGQIFDALSVRMANSQSINLSNENMLSLSRNTDTLIFGNISLKVADSDTPRFYPKVDYVIVEGEIPTTGPVHNINKGTNYTTIQAAINDASPGDEIHVDSGTYNENVNVTKQLTLRGFGMPVVDAKGSGSSITLAADGIALEGFTATGGAMFEAGIHVFSSGNTINGNNASSNTGASGIVLSSSNNNTLNGNNASNNHYFEQYATGIVLSSSNNNTLNGNNASNNGNGILLYYSSNNMLNGNNVTNRFSGIYLRYSSNNSISGNKATNNLAGIELEESSNNLIYNNLFNNTYNVQSSVSTTNTWNISRKIGTNIIGGPWLGGNFWSDYAGKDTDGDGLGDTLLPYNSRITDGGDYLPLVYSGTTPTPNNGTVHNINKGTNYTTIQAAINDASTGDEIHVDSGTYNENVNVNKQLTLRGFGMTVVDAKDNGSAIVLAADGIILEGFTATGSSFAGIQVTSNNNRLSGNNASSNTGIGILLSSSSNNTLTGNNASNNLDLNHDYNGIYLVSSSNNTLIGNNVWNNGNGISLDSSSNNKLSSNNVSSRAFGIYLDSSSNNTLSRNNASNSGLSGIILVYSISNTVSGNNASNNWDGGIYLYSSSNNVIYNNIFNNTNNVKFYGLNINKWNTTLQSSPNIIGGSNLGGNLWAHPNGSGFSQTCPDSNKDGICDIQYTLDSFNIDYLALANVLTGVNIISPNGGESWVQNTTQAILWNYSGSPEAYVKIETLKNGVPSIINSSTPNDGSHSWTIPSTQEPGTDYKIRISSTSNPAYTDTSNNNFTISSSTLLTCNISGIKFNDSNGNGAKDPGESGLSNWTIKIQYSNGTVAATVTTNATGGYCVNLPAGNYTISEVLQSGWTQTYPLAPGTYTVNLTALQTMQNVSFGNKKDLNCCTLPTGMVSWWPGDGNANDIQGGNHGTLQNGATFAAGKVGKAFSLDGVNDNVKILHSPSLNFGTGNFSIDAWIKTTASSGVVVLLDKRSGPTPKGYHLYLWNGKPGIQMARGVGSSSCDAYPTPGVACFNYGWSSPSIADGVWHHLVWVVDRTDLQTGVKIYVDSVLKYTGRPMTDDLNTTSDLYIGMRTPAMGGGGFFRGELDEVEIFNRALNQTDIQAIYNAGSAGKCKTQVGTIYGVDFNDLNGNGIRDASEPGLANWTIVLKNNTRSNVGTIMTDINGNYTFGGLAAGNYTVEEVLQANWTQTFPSIRIYNLTLAAGENMMGIDFGNYLIPPQLSGVNAERKIEKDSLRQGESTNITIRINSNVTQALALKEVLPTGWNLTRISDDAIGFKNGTNEWVWSNVTPGVTKTVIYEIKAPTDTAPGTYYINGTMSNSSGVIAIVGGNNIITFDILAHYRRLGNDPGRVETTDLLKAMEDWRRKTVPAGFINPITNQELLALINEWAMS